MSKPINLSYFNAKQQKKLGTLFVVCGALLLLASGWYWWDRIVMSPRNVFWGMIDSNMSVQTIQRNTTLPGSSRTVDQTAVLSFRGEPATDITTKVIQGENEVITQSLNYKDAAYARYLSIKQAQKGKPNADFSSILSQWSKIEQEGMDYSSQMLDSIVGPLLFGNLSRQDRKSFIEKLRTQGAYDVDYSKFTTEIIEGKKYFVYNVTLRPSAYVPLLNDYFKKTGIVTEQFSSSNFDGSEKLEFVMKISPISRYIYEVDYLDNSERKEYYSMQGSLASLERPSDAISSSEMQSKIEALQAKAAGNDGSNAAPQPAQ